MLRLRGRMADFRETVRAMTGGSSASGARVDTSGRNPYYPAFDACPRRVRGQVAQLVEHLTENQGVGGSTPSLATTQS